MPPHVLNASAFCLVCLSKEFTGYSVPSKTYAIMAPGKPVIGLFDKESEIGRAIKDAGCGFIAKENESPQDLKKKIIQAIKTGESKRMGENALKTFRENYTLQIALQKYHEAFKRTFF